MGSPVETDCDTQEEHDDMVRMIDQMELVALKHDTTLLDILKKIKIAKGLE